jgi:hypothetical protein
MMSDSSRVWCITGTPRTAATCRWATPTLFLDAPYWFAAEDTPWSCARDGVRSLTDATAECRTCVHWQVAARRTAEKPAPAA